MSPPIRTPDGSEVSEIVLPDGSTASQVIDPDGNVVFEAAPDIPDSGISRLPMNEGAGTSAEDVWGNNDATINGASWISDSAEGDFALSGDGSDDVVTQTGFYPPRQADFSVAIWVRFTSTADIYASSQFRSGNRYGLQIQNEVTSGSSDGLAFDIRSLDGSRDNIGTDTSLNDGDWHLFVGTRTYDPSAGSNQLNIYLDDGNDASTTANNTEGADDLGTQEVEYFYQEDRDTYSNIDIDDPRWYDKVLSQTEVSNLYNTGSISG